MEFLYVLFAAFVVLAWQSFGDESVTDGGAGDEGSEGAGDEGSSEVTSEESGEGGEESADAFTQALTKAGVPNWAKTGKRWYEKAQKSGELEKQLAELQAKVKGYEEKTTSSARNERIDTLTKQAISQGFTRGQVVDYLEDHTPEQLDARLADDRAKSEGSDTEEKTPKAVKEALDRIAKLEKAVTVKEQNAEMQRQLGEALGKHAGELDDEDKGFIVGVLEQAVTAARASGEKLPNIDESVKNLAARLKTLSQKAVEKFKETNKGTAAAGTAEQPNKDFEEQVASLESDEQDMLKAFRAS